MLYVERDANGRVLSVSRQARPGDEVVEDGHPDVLRFLGVDESHGGFNVLDADFVRVIEDVIDTLIENNVIKLTDLPAAAQRKLMARKGMRNKLQGALNLLGNDELIL
ncbi:hypothetical protein [Chitinimonas koreensis]|uniref:hypothetical protein n=1 Tax=Chitinimonas koreensis TaxID=356302 RepID=UPI00048F86DA|nr:hypothetical protein [Chitinimonas koreensis]QNM98523.1 hypothetical protein H9L41_09990 [Chitinimonas koreensis]